MIIYQIGTVTERDAASVDTLSYYGYITDITSDALVKNGLNHIYVEKKEGVADAKVGFCKILFVVGGTAYVAAPTKYSTGTLVQEAGKDTVQKIKITETLALENA